MFRTRPRTILRQPLDDHEEEEMATMTRHSGIRTLLVSDAMTAGVIACGRETPLSEVAATMAHKHLHCVVVEKDGDEPGPPWGIVSALDLVAAALVRDLDEQSAGGSVGSPVVTVAPDETLERAAQLMTENHATHLIVADRERTRPVGVLSTLDIAASLANRLP